MRGSEATIESGLNADNTAHDAAVAGGAVALPPDARLEAENTDFSGKTAPLGPDGDLAAGAEATLICYLTDPAAWSGAGVFSLNNDDCTIVVEPRSWGDVKALYR